MLRALGDFVQHIIVVFQLGRLSHQILLHEEWWLKRLVPPAGQERQAEIQECLIEEDARASEEIPTVTRYIVSSMELHRIDHLQKLEVRTKAVGLVRHIKL